MTYLVTGSAGHLGEALMRSLRDAGLPARGIDRKASNYTDFVGDIANHDFVAQAMIGITHVLHTATLHKPHVESHTYQDFVDTNISGTLVLLEAAVKYHVRAFVFTSTTSTFGSALTPPPDAPAAWITEEVIPVVKNIYGATKIGAENLCELFARQHKLPLVILRTSRFFPEEDDNAATGKHYDTLNAQANELLYRRVDIADVVDAHMLAAEKAPALGFGKYIISATTPFTKTHLPQLQQQARAVVETLFPQTAELYAAKQWQLFAAIDRVYVNTAARDALGWQPRHDFAYMLECLKMGRDFRSPLAIAIGRKGYHDKPFGVYTA